MKNLILLFALPLIFASALQAQITKEQADEIVKYRMVNETQPFTVFAKENLQTEGITILTSSGEEIELDYSCWVYYVKNFSSKNNNSYLIVKEHSGNLLEVNVWDTVVPNGLNEWRTIRVPCTGITHTECGQGSGKSVENIEFTYVEGKLFIKHVNAEYNCAFEIIDIFVSCFEKTIEIHEFPIPHDGVNCKCRVDVDFSAGKFESGTYTLVIYYLGVFEIHRQTITLSNS
jgi:hypothetical protein